MNVKTVSFQKNENLSVVQVAAENQNSFYYISAQAAINENLIQVKEISESGSVNMLHVYNLSDKFVFLMDGDVLAGAKQNRVLNTSVLLAPNSKINLPVSCVERGRWSRISEKFQSTDYVAPSDLRAKKARRVAENLRRRKEHTASQKEIWDEVDKYALKFMVQSKSSNLSDVYAEKNRDFVGFIESFKHVPEANGMAVFVKKNLLSMDIFNRTDIYAEYFPKILKGCALEVFGLPGNSELSEAEANYKTLNFIDQFEKLDFDEYPGVGIGTEKRFNTNGLTGFELSYNSHLIHLTALNIQNEKE